MNRCLEIVLGWMSANKLKFNAPEDCMEATVYRECFSQNAGWRGLEGPYHFSLVPSTLPLHLLPGPIQYAGIDLYSPVQLGASISEGLCPPL